MLFLIKITYIKVYFYSYEYLHRYPTDVQCGIVDYSTVRRQAAIQITQILTVYFGGRVNVSYE